MIPKTIRLLAGVSILLFAVGFFSWPYLQWLLVPKAAVVATTSFAGGYSSRLNGAVVLALLPWVVQAVFIATGPVERRIQWISIMLVADGLWVGLLVRWAMLRYQVSKVAGQAPSGKSVPATNDIPRVALYQAELHFEWYALAGMLGAGLLAYTLAKRFQNTKRPS
ncbi:MAG TPA: hypothetical protein PKD90_07950 [Phnomibacter sp.]|nr:hypothetical protein [Phnomibacter sp.]